MAKSLAALHPPPSPEFGDGRSGYMNGAVSSAAYD
jgi:hypothetical protein